MPAHQTSAAASSPRAVKDKQCSRAEPEALEPARTARRSKEPSLGSGAQVHRTEKQARRNGMTIWRQGGRTPVNASFRHISSGSHQKTAAS
eukprot:4142497-Prymnesium_polylepis.2